MIQTIAVMPPAPPQAPARRPDRRRAAHNTGVPELAAARALRISGICECLDTRDPKAVVQRDAAQIRALNSLKDYRGCDLANYAYGIAVFVWPVDPQHSDVQAAGDLGAVLTPGWVAPYDVCTTLALEYALQATDTRDACDWWGDTRHSELFCPSQAGARIARAIYRRAQRLREAPLAPQAVAATLRTLACFFARAASPGYDNDPGLTGAQIIDRLVQACVLAERMASCRVVAGAAPATRKQGMRR